MNKASCLLIAIMLFAAFYPAQNIYAKNLQQPSTTLCNTNEKIFFNCKIKNSINTLSVCASQDISKESGYIQYRFGRTGAIELEYPTEKEASRLKFSFSRYTRFKVSKLALNFSNNNVSYTVFDNYDGESKPFVKDKGVMVSRPGIGDKNIQLLCNQGAISNLDELEDLLPCDENLNFGGCK